MSSSRWRPAWPCRPRSTPRPPPMRIAFDGTTLTAGRTGVGYYSEHLLQHLAREVETSGDELIVISNKPVTTEQPLPRHVVVHEADRFPMRVAWMQGMAARVLDRIGA